MSSGRKTLKENTRERLISTDNNRVQSFVGAYANEAMREQMLAPMDDTLYIGTTFSVAGGATTAVDQLDVAAPTYGGVLNGLMVIVPIGVTYILITKGMLLMVDPDGQVGSSNPNPPNPDDLGPSKLVYSEGVLTAGSLTWVGNGGPGVRVDVVECQRVDLVVETDNRDIFNPATGAFIPAAVTKVVAGELTFRIRQGVPGGGLPAPALGWTPLAIISAPAGAINLDACAVWDVRQLLSDRQSPFAAVRSVPAKVSKYNLTCDRHSIVGQVALSGEVQGTMFGWRYGGIVSNESASLGYVNLLNLAYYAPPGFVLIPNAIYYLYAVFPVGYMRWVQYTQNAIVGVGGRCPGSFRGLIVVSHIPSAQNLASAPVPIPAGWGLGGSSQVAGVIASGTVADNGGVPVFMGFVADSHMIKHEWNTTSTFQAIAATITDTPPAVDFAFDLIPGTNYPRQAKRLRLKIFTEIAGSAITDQYRMDTSLVITDSVGGGILGVEDTKSEISIAPGGIIPQTATIEISIPNAQAPVNKYHWLQTYHPLSGATMPLSGITLLLRVTGWDE
jgi:hypothetical protein